MSKTVQILKALGLPFAYDHFAEGESPLPPFVVYKYTGANNFNADGVVYYPVNGVNVELYTDKKDIYIEKRLEHILTDAEICYTKSEVWIESEKLYEILYSFDDVSVIPDIESLEERIDKLDAKIDTVTADKSTETSLALTLTEQHILQRFIELPEDCDASKAIVFTLQGVVMQRGVDWQVKENEYPRLDLISWVGLELDGFAQAGDKVFVTYYKKV